MITFHIINITKNHVNPWKYVASTGSQCAHITREDLGIRLKIDNRINPFDVCIKENSSDKIVISHSCMLVNDYRNLNPIILSESEDFTFNDHHYVILTLGDDYTLLRSKWFYGTEVLNTFTTEKSGTRGCIICVDKRLEKDQFGEIRILDKSTNKFLRVTFKCDGHICTVKSSIIKKDEDIQALIDVENRYKNPLKFKMIVNKPVTKVYITVAGKEKELMDALKRYDYIMPVIYSIPSERIDDIDYLMSILSDIRERNIRAITEYEIKIPFEVMCKLKILYIFMMELTSNIIKMTCIKSI